MDNRRDIWRGVDAIKPRFTSLADISPPLDMSLI
jgi:hypothetical protein